MRPDELDELLGAYALDAVDDRERRLVEQYLNDHPRARDEVRQHREVATMLAFSGAEAPEGLWDRIAASLEEPAPPIELPVLGERRREGRRGRARLGRGWVAGIAAAAAAAVLIAGLGVTVARQGQRIDELGRELAAGGVAERAAYALADPRAKRATLRSESGPLAVLAAVEPSGMGYLVADPLPPLPDDRTYQLWGVIDGRVISLGVLGRDPRVQVFQADGPLTMLVITEEIAGGVPVSEQPALVAGELS